MASRLRPMSSGGLTTVVKRPLVVLHLKKKKKKKNTKTSEVYCCLVDHVWSGSGPVEYIPWFRCTVILSLSACLAVRAWDQSVPYSRSVGPIISFCPLVVWLFVRGGGERLTILVKFGCSLARRGENVAKISACPRWLLLLSPLRQTLS